MTTAPVRPSLSSAALFNMSFGFFGIQFGWALQMANMSAIYEYLGARADQIPMLWLAAPLTGLLVQPVIGHLSDHTWTRLGRRRPYFLTGAILSSIALVLMPQSASLLFAALLLWVLDTSINISMEPFRAFVADLLPESQRTRGFAMQGLFIGLGAVLASALPWVLNRIYTGEVTAAGTVPATVRWSFYAGSFVFLAAVLWTVSTTHEYPPQALEKQPSRESIFRGVGSALLHMPVVMRQLAPVQLATWLGLFCMWLYFPVAVARNVFGAADVSSPVYTEGVAWGGICFAMYSLVCFLFSLILPRIAASLGPRKTHVCCLLAGAAGLISVSVIHNKYLLLLSMTGVGIAWASTLSMPYALLADDLPRDKIGVFMGIFNFFIVLPEIAASLGFGWVMQHLLGNNRLSAVVIGGAFMALAAAILYLQKEPVPAAYAMPQPQEL